MKYDREPEVRFASSIDIELACDGDTMAQWESASGESSTPSYCISLKEALIAGTSRPLEREDLNPVSNN